MKGPIVETNEEEDANAHASRNAQVHVEYKIFLKIC